MNKDELKLSYEINSGIPFRWEYEIEDHNIVKFDRNYVERDDNKGGLVGAKVTTAYIFKGIKPGKTTITFKLVSITKEHEPSNIEVHNVIVDDNLNIKIEVNKMKEVYEFLKECGVYYLGTVDNDKPRVRPFGTVNIYEDHLYIQTGKKKDVYKQIITNPNVEICAFNNDKWIRVEGKLVEDNRVEAKKDMLDHYPELRNMYDENDDNTIVFYLESGKATISSFTEAPHVIEF